MKNIINFFFLLLIASSLISCNDKSENKAGDSLPKTSVVVTDYNKLQESVKKILESGSIDPSVLEDLKQIDTLLGQMNEMQGTHSITPDAFVSGPIEFEKAIIRKDSFDTQFSRLRPIFPEYFEIEKKHIDDLYKKLEFENTFDVIRMYPIYDSRGKDRVLYSYAFIGGKKHSANFKDFVIDILDPCPPPFSGCKDLKDAVNATTTRGGNSAKK